MAQRGRPFPKGTSGNPGGKRKRPEGIPRLDDWYSATTGLGRSTYDKRYAVDFAIDPVTSEAAADLWRGDDLAARIIETPPNEMLRAGFDLCIVDDEVEQEYEAPEADRPMPEPKVDSRDRARRFDEAEVKDLQEAIATRWEELDVVGHLWNGLAYERAYGGAAILLGAQDGATDMALPLREESIRSLDWLTVLEPRELSPHSWYSDPKSQKFGEPEVWQLNMFSPGGTTAAQVSTLVHESRLITFPGIRVSRQIQSGTLSGWGDSILTRVRRVLRDFNISWGSAGVLVSDFAQAVFKMKGLAEIFATDQDGLFATRMKALELGRSVTRAIIIDEAEDFERKSTSVTGLPELLDRFATRLAAAADMPLTLLMGQSPAGLNATGESDVRFFYDRMASAQVRKLRPALERLTGILLRLEGDEPENWSIKFRPLWQPTEKEKAEARKVQAETDQIYLNAGVLSSDEVARSRFGGDEYSFDTVVDFSERAMADKLEAKLQSEALAAQAAAGQAAGPGGESDGGVGEDPAAPAPAAKEDSTQCSVEYRDGRWAVVRAGEVLSTHVTKAEAQKASNQ